MTNQRPRNICILEVQNGILPALEKLCVKRLVLVIFKLFFNAAVLCAVIARIVQSASEKSRCIRALSLAPALAIVESVHTAVSGG